MDILILRKLYKFNSLFGSMKYKKSVSLLDLKKQNEVLLKSLRKLTKDKKNLEEQNVELISVASHEMKTPLTSITSIVQLIFEGKMGKISEKQKENLGIALHDARRLNVIIKNMLDVSKIEEGRVIYKFESVDLRNLITESLKTAKQMLKEKKISVKVDCKGPLKMVADGYRIEQVILNLMTNAIKYGKVGGHIWITAKRKKGKILLAVKDDGKGMSEQNVLKLFRKGFQVERTERVLMGLGYGLYISRKILDRHKGKIWVETKLGKGSTFFVSLNPELSGKKLK